MSARLTILLGAGGVGKTTLAAGYALALARSGARVGLLGVDPSRRLQGALGVALGDEPRAIPECDRCLASILTPAESLRRWAAEGNDERARVKLVDNPFFVALADRLATATDVIAAVRVAEWVASDPSLDELVVDTAPGSNAVELLRRPRLLAAFLEGELVVWLRRLSNASAGLGARAGLVVAALARVGGARLLLALGEFLAAIEGPTRRILERVGEAQQLVENDARIVLVTTIRDDAASAARAMKSALEAIDLAPAVTVVNRALPARLDRELATIDGTALPTSAAVLARYAASYASTQTRVLEAVAPFAPRSVAIPLARGLTDTRRIEALAALGEPLRRALLRT